MIDRCRSKSIYADAPLRNDSGGSEASVEVASMQPLDVNVLRNLVGDDPLCIREFLQAFRASAILIALDVEQACAAGNSEKAVSAVHKLKSAALSVGAMALGELCADMEQIGRAGQLDALGLAFEHFKLEMAAVDAHLAVLLSSNTEET